MRDQYGRDIRDLRISLTDRCNLRCVYCMPAEGIDFRPPDELLQDGELLLLVRVAAELGVTKVRLTGEEPTVHSIPSGSVPLETIKRSEVHRDKRIASGWLAGTGRAAASKVP